MSLSKFMQHIYKTLVVQHNFRNLKNKLDAECILVATVIMADWVQQFHSATHLGEMHLESFSYSFFVIGILY